MARRDENGVPILDLGEGSSVACAEARRILVDPNEDTVTLVGETVHLHNPRSRVGVSPDVTTFHIGAETLDEAAKSVVGVFDDVYGVDPPTWVASTHEGLAGVLADHYGCEIRSMDEELSA